MASERVVVELTELSLEAIQTAVALTGDVRADVHNRALQIYARLVQEVCMDGTVLIKDAVGSLIELNFADWIHLDGDYKRWFVDLTELSLEARSITARITGDSENDVHNSALQIYARILEEQAIGGELKIRDASGVLYDLNPDG